MSLEVRYQGKAVVIGWDDKIKGSTVSMQVDRDGEQIEIKNTLNDGEANVYFPADYTGDFTITVKGSKSGEASDTLHVN